MASIPQLPILERAGACLHPDMPEHLRESALKAAMDALHALAASTTSARKTHTVAQKILDIGAPILVAQALPIMRPLFAAYPPDTPYFFWNGAPTTYAGAFLAARHGAAHTSPYAVLRMALETSNHDIATPPYVQALHALCLHLHEENIPALPHDDLARDLALLRMQPNLVLADPRNHAITPLLDAILVRAVPQDAWLDALQAIKQPENAIATLHALAGRGTTARALLQRPIRINHVLTLQADSIHQALAIASAQFPDPDSLFGRHLQEQHRALCAHLQAHHRDKSSRRT